MKTPQLQEGRYFGETVRRRGGHGVVVSEIRFPPRASIPRHSHNRSIFNFVLAGAYTEYLDQRNFECRPPVLLFHPSGLVHWERFSRTGARCLTVEFDPAWLDEMGRPLEEAMGFERGEWTWMAGRLRQELYVRDDFTPMVIEAYLGLLLAAGLRHGRRHGSSPPAFVERARELLHDRYNERLDLASVAHELGVHPTHLARAFHRHLGATPGEYVRRLRVEFACRELASPDRSLAEIAQAAGFADQSHFTRTFKRLTGYTPARYRTDVLGR